MVTLFFRRPLRSRLLQYFAFAIFFITGCGKNAHVRWVYYDETKCADKWTFTNNNEALKQNVISYMKSKGITIHEMEIFNDRTAESCGECNCKSGRRMKCKIKRSDVKEIKKEGFYE